MNNNVIIVLIAQQRCLLNLRVTFFHIQATLKQSSFAYLNVIKHLSLSSKCNILFFQVTLTLRLTFFFFFFRRRGSWHPRRRERERERFTLTFFHFLYSNVLFNTIRKDYIWTIHQTTTTYFNSMQSRHVYACSYNEGQIICQENVRWLCNCQKTRKALRYLFKEP